MSYTESEVNLKLGDYVNYGRDGISIRHVQDRKSINSGRLFSSGTNKIYRNDYKRTSRHRKTDLIKYTQETKADSGESAFSMQEGVDGENVTQFIMLAK